MSETRHRCECCGKDYGTVSEAVACAFSDLTGGVANA